MHNFRRGFQISVLGLLTSALVALPFSGGFAIAVAYLWNPESWILVLLAGLIQYFATFWIAGWWLRRCPPAE
ncbi:hypothetical protein [Roseinatronobacter sp. S2]|uniref:hypothetical protein n=1 Tax=Roseinatronobacter sp. S2 TaxID=3035471 RepID=UPI00240FEE78|nr:hypothetical protein [Roseinatronobacter sp. S2]WFE74337.1 hypothetical protein P8S53_14275 [Roseinatronobacter sp. S2]